MQTLPVFAIDASQVGPLGLTLGQPANLGGATDPQSVVIPLIEVTWFDERQTCDRVHDFVFYSTPPDLAGCQAYVEGRCRLMGNGTPCAFHEGPEATVWAKARRWKRVPRQCEPEPPHFHKWAYFHDPNDQHVDGEPLPEDEDEEVEL